METALIYALVGFVTVIVFTFLFVLVKRRLRINKLRKHLATDYYVVEFQDLTSEVETKVLLKNKQTNKDYMADYCQSQRTIFTTSVWHFAHIILICTVISLFYNCI